jgi:hypothetical protein
LTRDVRESMLSDTKLALPYAQGVSTDAAIDPGR